MRVIRITRAPVAAAVLALGLGACKDGAGPPGDPGVLSLNVGESRTLSASQAATVRVSGGPGGEFVMIPFHASQTPGSTVALEFTGTDIGGVSGPPTPQVGPASEPQLSREPGTDGAGAAARFHGDLRRTERDVLGPKLAALRASHRDPLLPLRSVAAGVPNPGDQVSFNVNARPQQACDPPDFRAGRVVTVSERAIIVADNNNPPGGFTDAEYVAIAQAFDALVYPTITGNFGTPGDIDQNGARSVIFYTRAVNELTPAGSESVVGGFFHPRDLFPKQSTDPNLQCPSSNEAEMFYMLVPDEGGAVNGNVRTKAYVQRTTVGVLAHEFQHLINASRRITNKAEDFEDLWLNEGLSHIAEELTFYRASGLAPRQNTSLEMLVSTPTIRNAVNSYQVSNFARLIDYLEDPEQRTPFAENDELATRGATWSLLRFAADRSTKPEQQIWTSFAGAKTVGIANFTSVIGGSFLDVVRDWTIANYTDDAVPGTTFRHPSWHYRSILPALVTNEVYPLKTRPLAAGTQLSLSLKGGSAAYLRFSVPANVTASITATSSGSPLPATAAVSITVVRTK